MYQMLFSVICVAHMALVLWEAPGGDTPLSSDDTARLEDQLATILLVGICCITLYWCDLLLYCYVHDGLKRYERPHSVLRPSIAADLPPADETDLLDRRLQNGSQPPIWQWSLLTRAALILIITADWTAQLVLGTTYTTGPAPRDSTDDIVLLLPYTALLRPVVFILRSDSLRAGTFGFLRTLQKSSAIFMLFAALLVVFGVVGVVLFTDANGSNFADIFAASSTLFTYMSTAENWPSTVWPIVACEHANGHEDGWCPSYLFHVYFAMGSILGTVVMVSLLIATFESEYTKQHKDRDETKRARQLEGIVASYLVLDCGGLNQLKVKQTSDFLAAVNLNHVKLGKEGMGMRALFDNMRLSVGEFAELCEQLLKELRSSKLDKVSFDQVDAETAKIRKRASQNLRRAATRSLPCSTDMLKGVRSQSVNKRALVGPSPTKMTQDALDLYAAVDEDGDGTLSIDEVRHLCEIMGMGMTTEKLACAMADMDKDDDGGVSFDEFNHWWHSNVHQLYEQDDYDAESTGHFWALSVVSVVHCLSLASINTGMLVFGLGMDVLCTICAGIFHVDVLFRVLAVKVRISWDGWKFKLTRKPGSFNAFWDVPHSIFAQAKNRYDLSVSILSVFFAALAVGQVLGGVPQAESTGQQWFGGVESWNRIAIAIPIMRLFSAAMKLRTIWFCLGAILPQYTHLFTLCCVGIYWFACLGCWLLAGRFRHLDESVYDMPQANFNSMLDSPTTLFQLLIGEAWDGVKQVWYSPTPIHVVFS